MSHQARETDSADGGRAEEIPLQDAAGACENGEAPHASSSSGRGHGRMSMSAMKQHVGTLRQAITSCCPEDRYHRKLAIGSIVCGLSCVGACALIDSVKAEHDVEKEEFYTKRARCRAITSIALGFAIPILLIVLVIFGSYLITLID